MASSSFSAAFSQTSKKYDVFVSFRGEDTRTNFTSHLHEALCRDQIETYIDYRLEKGDEAWSSIVKAIQDSTLFLIVFSENYASSSWCLNELTKILECSKDHKEHLVIPVFYRIDPSHVRKQTGSYQIAFSKYKHTNHSQQVPKWKDALTEAASLSGWHCDAQRNEAELIREIVKDVLIKLDSMYQSGYSDDFIGINQKIAYLESLLCNESQDVRFIGIWGMGGIGKTTIAKALFNKLCFAFESFCFLTNVREELEKYGITYLKNKLFSMLLEDEQPHKGMPDGGSPYVWRRLRRKKVLVVLDDVNDLEQLENLVGVPCWFGQDSRVIITTRDKQVLGKYIDNIYEVKALDFNESLCLFNLKAFKNSCLAKDFEQLSKNMVDYAQGIPLALVVLGSLLYDKCKEEWESELEKLKKMPHTKIQQILKLSYDGLDHEEKNIFLDIACFFKSRPVKQVQMLLNACGYSTSIGLKTLQDKALVTISNEIVDMHDLIQEMGQQIVREESLEDPSKRSRLWNTNDIYQILKNNKRCKAIKSIKLDMSKIEELNLSPRVFAKLPKLKFLEFYNISSEEHNFYFPQGLESLPGDLRYLRWDKYPLKSLPLTFSAENLVELHMPDSNIKQLWQGVQNVVNLKVIYLHNSKNLMEFPDLSKALHLEEVVLSDCASLREVHPSILSLDKLELLILDNCVGLTSLKSDIHLRSLRHLSLYGCSSLKEFSITSKNMKHLDLQWTAINEFPSSIVCLSLPIEGTAVERLPKRIKHLSSLTYLNLSGCTRLRSITELPPSIEDLVAGGCSSLEKLQFTSTAADPIKPTWKYICFSNCVKLDQHSIKAILANVLVDVNKSVSQLENKKDEAINPSDYEEKISVAYPGSRVPEWFKYRTTHATSIVIDLSSAPLSADWGFIFCFVAPRFPLNGSFFAECQVCFRIINDQRVDQGDDNNKEVVYLYFEVYGGKLASDHVFLCYDESFSIKIHQRIKENRAISNPKVISRIDFHCQIKRALTNLEWQYVEIKECGICPTYSSEYHNFIKQEKLESQASVSEMGVGCSYEEETLLPRQQSKALIFPLPPTASTWKSGTQGLKDIINL